MDVELHALEKTQTWIVVDLPARKSPIGYRWVYKAKSRQIIPLKGTKQG